MVVAGKSIICLPMAGRREGRQQSQGDDGMKDCDYFCLTCSRLTSAEPIHSAQCRGVDRLILCAAGTRRNANYKQRLYKTKNKM